MFRDELQMRRILQRKTAPQIIRHPIDVTVKKQFAREDLPQGMPHSG